MLQCVFSCLSEISLATKTTLPEVANAALIGLKTLLEKKNVQQINDKRKPKKYHYTKNKIAALRAKIIPKIKIIPKNKRPRFL